MVISTYLMASVVLWVMWTSLLAWVAVRRRTWSPSQVTGCARF